MKEEFENASWCVLFVMFVLFLTVQSFFSVFLFFASVTTSFLSWSRTIGLHDNRTSLRRMIVQDGLGDLGSGQRSGWICGELLDGLELGGVVDLEGLSADGGDEGRADGIAGREDLAAGGVEGLDAVRAPLLDGPDLGGFVCGGGEEHVGDLGVEGEAGDFLLMGHDGEELLAGLSDVVGVHGAALRAGQKYVGVMGVPGDGLDVGGNLP